MSETPILTDNDLTSPEQQVDPDFGKKSLRVVALQHASMFTNREAPIDELLENAVKIEDFLQNGKSTQS